MPARGLALSFDPHYVDFVISAWQQQEFPAISPLDLQHLVAEYAAHVYTKLTMIGLAEQHVKPTTIISAVTLLKSLKLIKQTSSGPRNAKVVKLAASTFGHKILGEVPAAGSIRIGLVGLIVKQSPQLTALLHTLDEDGALSRPVANPLPGTPRKGAAFNRALLEGLVEYESKVSTSIQTPVRLSAKQTATQRLKEAAAQATRRHPASALPSLEKLLSLAADLGLIWRDVNTVNQALGIESFGSAVSTHEGAVIPHVPKWSDVQRQFIDVLLRVYRQRVDGSGYTTVETLRGGIGRDLHISAPVVDSFLSRARDLSDHGEFPYLLQFEPDDDLLYSPDRRPLIWHETAFDVVEVRQAPDSLPALGISSARQRTGSSSFS